MTTLAFIGQIGGGELLLIFVVFLLLFGSKKLPSIARNLGRTMAELQRAAHEVREEFLRADMELRQSESPPSPSLPTPSEESSYGEWHPDIPPTDGGTAETPTPSPSSAETTEPVGELESLAAPAGEAPASQEAKSAPSPTLNESPSGDTQPDLPPTDRHDQTR
jgi:TatA/E family protein of Tat protein translocase